MVKIRLRRMGAKKAPFYRVVVADSRYPRSGLQPLWTPPAIKVSCGREEFFGWLA